MLSMEIDYIFGAASLRRYSLIEILGTFINIEKYI